MSNEKQAALKVMINGEEREISFEELTLSNNLAQEALVRLLITKKIIEPEEYVKIMETVRDERYRVGEPGDSAPGK